MRRSTGKVSMIVSQAPFFISFFERSGSSFLVDLLDSHPDVFCLHEVFYLGEGQTRPDHLATRQAVRAQLDRIYTRRYTASGFKFKYPTQYQLYPDVYEYLRESADKLRIIYLYRKNVLKAAISKQNQLHLHNIGKPANLTDKNYISLGKTHLDIDVALRYMKVRQAMDKKYFEELKHFKNKYVLAYEDLLKDTTSVTKDLFAFLGVDTRHEASSRTVKITDDDIQKALANYEELVEKITGTGYEHYLFDEQDNARPV